MLWRDVYNEVLTKHDENRLTTWKRDYKGVQSIPPAIEVGDKVRVCKARWVAEGTCDSSDEQYLREGTVVSITRDLNRYFDRDQTIYEVYFEPYFTSIGGRFHGRTPVTLRVSYKEIYSHKPKGVNFTYMLNRNSSVVDESPFIYPDMDIASWYPKSMTHLSDESNVIGKVDKMEANEDGVKIYISQPPRCGKNFFEEIRKMADKALDFKCRPLPEEAIGQLFPENPVKKPIRDYPSYIKKHPIIPDEIKTIKNGDTIMKTVDLRVKNIIHNGPCTIVFWMDNTKTIVKLKPGDTYDPHAAFCIAVAKKVYGNNSKISKIVDQFSKDAFVPEMPTRDLTIEELKAAADKLGYRVARKPKKK